MSRLLRAFVSLVPLLLAACPPTPPITLKTITLFPTQTDGLNGGYQWTYAENAYCDVPLPGQGLFTNGLGPEPLPGGEIDAGYEDIYNQGAQPFPCEEEQQTLYRGHVMFDFSQFDSVGGATLQFNVVQSENTTGGPAEIPADSYATVLGMSTGLQNGDNGPYYWGYDNPGVAPVLHRRDHQTRLPDRHQYRGPRMGCRHASQLRTDLRRPDPRSAEQSATG